MLKSLINSVADWFKTAAGMVVLAAIILAGIGVWSSGPYILVNTIVYGGMLGLMAMGLALVFGVMNVAQFAHGEFFMVGSLVAFYVFTPISEYLYDYPNDTLSILAPFLGIAAATVVGAITGLLTELVIFRELRRRSRENWIMNSFLLTLGLGTIMINSHQVFFSADFKGIVGYWDYDPIRILGVNVSIDRALTFCIAVVAITCFWMFMKYTRLGRAIRAVSQDETGAQMVGIEVGGIFLFTMALACALAALAGSSLLFMFPSYPTVGMYPLYMSWFVVILVGLGNTMGALIGGFLVALVKELTVLWIGEGWDMVIPSLIIVLVLIFKPSGIFGSEVRSIHEM